MHDLKTFPGRNLREFVFKNFLVIAKTSGFPFESDILLAGKERGILNEKKVSGDYT